MHKEYRRRRSGIHIAARLIGLVKPMLPVMLAAITMGVIGYLCAIGITVGGVWALLGAAGFAAPLAYKTIFGLLAAFALARGVLRYAEQASNHYIAFKLLAIIRSRVFAALRRLAPAKLETRDKGDLISLITTDIELLEVFYAHTISPVAIALLVSLCMLALTGAYHIALALVLLTGYLLVGLIIPLFIATLGSGVGLAFRAESGVLSSYVLDSLRGLREVLQFGQGPARLKKMGDMTEELAALSGRMKRYESLATALTNTGILLTALASLITGAVLYAAGLVSFTGLVTAFVVSIGSFGPVVALSSLSSDLTRTFAAADRVLDILDEAPLVEEVENGKTIPFGPLAAENVSFAYEEEKILENVSLTIHPGTITGLYGKSGSGKSTLLRLMMRFWDVDSGRITFSGEDVRCVNTKTLRGLRSLVMQDTVLFNDTIAGNVRIGKPEATMEEIEAACRKASLHDLILTLPNGYDTPVGELGSSLSGGERQRIGLARAFLHDAPLLLLDEPTSNLDSLNEGIILRSLKEEGKGRTVVLVSHRAATLGIADRVIKMNEARQS